MKPNKPITVGLVLLLVGMFTLPAEGRVVREDVNKVSDERKIEILTSRVVGRNINLQDWEKQWVKKQEAAIYPKINHLVWLKNARLIINPEKQSDLKVFYPGIGPYVKSPIDIVSVLLATNYTQLIGIDKQRITFQEFKDSIKAALVDMEDIEILEFNEVDTLKYSVDFRFEGRKREVVVYYGTDGNYFFPPELEEGYSVIYTRWMTTVFEPGVNNITVQIREDWVKYLKPDTGFVVADGEYPYFDRSPNEFWNKFLEVPLKEKISISVIANARRVHLFVIKNHISSN